MHLFSRERSMARDICLVLAFLMIIEPALLIQPLFPDFSSKAHAASNPPNPSSSLYTKPLALIVRLALHQYYHLHQEL